MKKVLFLLSIILALFGCQMIEFPTDPVIYMGGGKWTLADYSLNVTDNSSGSQITILENDTVCINSFIEMGMIGDQTVMKQDYNGTSVNRRFIKGKTQWEFDAYNLYCEWINTPNGLTPITPSWINYRRPGQMEITDPQNIVTNFDFITNNDNNGSSPPNNLTLISPSFHINLYSSANEKSKAITLQLILYFIR